MTQPSERSLENKNQKIEFQDRITSVTTRQIHGADALAEYADLAIEELTDVIEDILASYAVDATEVPADSRSAERAALQHFGLKEGVIDNTLSELITVNAQIQHILAENVHVEDKEFVPTQLVEMPIKAGSGNGYERIILQPRGATIKFIISRLLNSDWDELKRTGRAASVKGRLDPNWVRKTSYELITTTDFDRSIMVCDEKGNRTFVFSRSKLKQIGIDDEALKDMDKPEMTDLIHGHPGIGMSLIYEEETYVESIGTLLTGLEGDEKMNETASELLLPYIDDSVHTANQITLALNSLYGCKLSHKTVIDAARSLAEEGLVRNQEYRLGPKRTAVAYDKDEFEIIHQQLGERDMLYPVADKDDLSFPTAVARKLNLTPPVIERLAPLAGVVAEDLPFKRFQHATMLACNKRQFERLESFIAENSDQLSLKSKVRSARVLSQKAIVSAVGTGVGWDALMKIGEELGIDTSSISSVEAPEISTLKEYAERKGYVKAPEGYKTLKMLQDEKGFQYRDMQAALDDLCESIGPVGRHIYGPHPYDSYSPAQQQAIIDSVERIRAARPEKRTAGRLTAPEIAKELGVSGEVVRNALKRHNAEVITQLVNNRPSPTYDDSYVDVLRNDETVKMRLAGTYGHNVQSKTAIAKEWHISPKTINDKAKQYHVPLGTFMIGPKPEDGYFPHDRAYVKKLLEDDGYDLPKED